MGQSLTGWLTGGIFNELQAKILVVGLDGVGKTTILDKIERGKLVQTFPTVGFMIKTLQHKKTNFTMWDVGGRQQLRKLWKHYYTDSDAIIFVVDSNDKDRLDESRDELHKMMSDEILKSVSLLILVNKQDLPNALNPNQLVTSLELNSIKQNWFIQPCQANIGDGLNEGFEWLIQSLKNK